ncbi:hypothetical protein Pan216_19240 [Planctomycetes bacterium Pan216]|uniref:Uncharacterized protein n=1 Tax=Kolteria novifilia TaxID=2527975 RepID=A0A518B257_9BACT|nr:hypothetical protein Pan216_19240 [Planctomycetes bacterium Pan216]
MQTDKVPRQLSQPKPEPTFETEPSVLIGKFVHEVSAL